MLSTNWVSSWMLLDNNIFKQRHKLFITSNPLLAKAFSFPSQVHSTSKHSQTPTGLLVLTQEGMSLVSASSLIIHWFLGNPRNKTLFLALLSKKSIEAWPMYLRNCWILALLNDLHITISTHIALLCDNKFALHIAVNPVFHERTKHIDIDCHLVQKKFQQGIIKTLHVFSQNQLAEILTKLLFLTQLQFLLCKMGTLYIYAPSWGGSNRFLIIHIFPFTCVISWVGYLLYLIYNILLLCTWELFLYGVTV